MSRRKPRREREPSPLDAIASEIQAILDPKEIERRIAAIEFESNLRALGPVPAALRSVDDNTPSDTCFFREAVLDLDDLADRASDQLRESLHSSTPRPDEPDPMAIAVAVAAYALWHESWRNEDADIIQVADSAGIKPRELRWAIRYARLTARRLRQYPAMHAAYVQAFDTTIRVLTKGFLGRDGFLKTACRTPGATRSIEDVLD